MGNELETDCRQKNEYITYCPETKLQMKNVYITYFIRDEGKYLKKLCPNFKNERSNIRFKLIKEIKLPFEITTHSKHLEYVDKIKTILFNCYSKIFCFKWPELVRIPEYEEILNCQKV